MENIEGMLMTIQPSFENEEMENIEGIRMIIQSSVENKVFRDSFLSYMNENAESIINFIDEDIKKKAILMMDKAESELRSTLNDIDTLRGSIVE